jgi:methylated-DNA-[protein]-cysteine S-methyltransferase
MLNNPYSAVITSPIGKLGISITNNTLTQLNFLPAKTELIRSESELAKAVCNELHHYFGNANYPFKINFSLSGTPFQLSVWDALQRIPVGKTLTYGELAKKLKTSPRAIGNACRTNPIPLIIPCHRITAQNGLGGFMGETKDAALEIKKWLLQHEGARITF